MKQLKKKIRVTTVTPYYINTGMLRRDRVSHSDSKPESAARKIIRGIERNRIFVSIPWSVHFVRLSQGLLPVGVFDWFVGRVLSIYKTMDHFQEHKN